MALPTKEALAASLEPKKLIHSALVERLVPITGSRGRSGALIKQMYEDCIVDPAMMLDLMQPENEEAFTNVATAQWDLYLNPPEVGQ